MINKNVNQYTRAGINGKAIICPNCLHSEKVYHFSWSALSCANCDQMINKPDWLLEAH